MYLNAHNCLGMVAVGVATGILGAILGTGGGVLLIPVLLLVVGVPMHYAVATSIVSVIATSSAVASTNVERGTANMRLGMVLEVATSLGAITGGLTAGRLPPWTLEGLFAIVLLPTAYLMWRGRTEQGGAADDDRCSSLPPSASAASHPTDDVGALGARFRDDTLGREVSYRVRHLWAGMLIAFVAGNLSGLLGIGGGVFKVPALNLVCGVPIKAAAATSNFMIGVTAAASAFLYYGRGEVRPALTAAVVLGVLGGSSIGSAVNRRIPSAAIRRLFAVLLALVALQMFFRAVSR